MLARSPFPPTIKATRLPLQATSEAFGGLTGLIRVAAHKTDFPSCPIRPGRFLGVGRADAESEEKDEPEPAQPAGIGTGEFV